MNPSCGTCRFGVIDSPTEIACHRFPPWVVDTLEKTDFLWPILRNTEWCGEFEEAD